MTNILVVEKGAEIQHLLQGQRVSEPLMISTVRTIDEVLDKCSQIFYDVVIWDIHAAYTSASYGLELIEVLSVDSPRTQVIVVANRDNVRLAIDCLQAGAYYTLHRPLDGEVLWALMDVALQKRRSLDEPGLSTTEPHTLHRFDALIGSSAPMQVVYERIQQSAATDVTVLITGETGTGKDLVAAAIHKHSQRKDGPYLAVNTGAMSPELIPSELFGYEKGAFTGAVTSKPGQFEQAHGGTIFLDEIGTMDMKAQISLLRLLETKTLRRLGGRKAIKVDVRLIAATNEDPEQAMAQGTFRQDLYYRLDVFRIDLPPLRDRQSDILLLAREFLSRFNAMYHKTVAELAPETVHCLEQYNWPGNVRELKNVMHRAVLIAQDHVLTADLLPDRVRNVTEAQAVELLEPVQVGMTLSEMEREWITMALAATGGNKKATAQMLGISRRALYNKLKRYGLL